MNNDEMMFIVKTNMEETEANSVCENLKSVISSMKGELTSEKALGQKKLAYAINKEITGFYYVLNFKANNELIAELDRKSKIDERILRHMIIKLDEE